MFHSYQYLPTGAGFHPQYLPSQTASLLDFLRIRFRVGIQPALAVFQGIQNLLLGTIDITNQGVKIGIIRKKSIPNDEPTSGMLYFVDIPHPFHVYIYIYIIIYICVCVWICMYIFIYFYTFCFFFSHVANLYLRILNYTRVMSILPRREALKSQVPMKGSLAL